MVVFILIIFYNISIRKKLLPEGGATFFRGGGGGGQFQGGGGGPNANFYRNPYNLLFSGGGVRTPYSPSGSAHAQASSILVIRMDCLRKTRAFISLHKRAV